MTERNESIGEQLEKMGFNYTYRHGINNVTLNIVPKDCSPTAINELIENEFVPKLITFTTVLEKLSRHKIDSIVSMSVAGVHYALLIVDDPPCDCAEHCHNWLEDDNDTQSQFSVLNAAEKRLYGQMKSVVFHHHHVNNEEIQEELNKFELQYIYRG